MQPPSIRDKKVLVLHSQVQLQDRLRNSAHRGVAGMREHQALQHIHSLPHGAMDHILLIIAVMRPCLDCYQHLMEIGIQRNVRLPSSDKEPLLLEQLAEFHMAVEFNAGRRISYDQCVAIVKREHPKWKKYREQLALDTTDMSLDALRARREYYQTKLKQVEIAIDAAESVIVNHVVS